VSGAEPCQDGREILEVFLYLAGHPPPSSSYPQWVAIALRGVKATERGDASAVKAACGECHALYKQRFRREFRGQPAHPHSDPGRFPAVPEGR
jgi:hypothetical protein